jgi:hypothetical protein
MNNREAKHALIGRYVRAISENAPNLAPFTRDATYGGPMLPDSLRGAEAIRHYLGEIAPFIKRFDPLQTIVEDDKAAMVAEIEGIRGRVLKGALVFEFEGDEIRAVQSFFDSRLLLRDLT